MATSFLHLSVPATGLLAGLDAYNLHRYLVDVSGRGLRPFETAPPYFGDEAQFAARDPASIADARPQLARVLRISIDVGDRDAWLPGVQNLHDHLVADEVPHTFEVLPGDHSDAYWTNNVGRYLRWYGTAFAP